MGTGPRLREHVLLKIASFDTREIKDYRTINYRSSFNDIFGQSMCNAESGQSLIVRDLFIVDRFSQLIINHRGYFSLQRQHIKGNYGD